MCQWSYWFSIGSDNYLNQYWFIVNWTLRNKIQWNSNQNTKFFIHEYAFANVCHVRNGGHFDLGEMSKPIVTYSSLLHSLSWSDMVSVSLNLVNIDSVNGLAPNSNRCQAITWSNADLLPVTPSGIHFNKILFVNWTIPFQNASHTLLMTPRGQILAVPNRWIQIGLPWEFYVMNGPHLEVTVPGQHLTLSRPFHSLVAEL